MATIPSTLIKLFCTPPRLLFRACGRCGRAYRRGWQKANWWQRILLFLSTSLLLLITYVLAVQFNFLWLFGSSPSIDNIRNPRTAMASELLSSDGKVLGRFFNENRQPVPYDSIDARFFQALIATEDERFYEHHGVDFYAFGAALKDAALGRARGASTITQQLVKNMFRVRTQYSTGLLGYIPGLSILIKKSKEMIIAVELEFFCDKKEILTLYANTVDFGSNAYGIKTAAKTYFNTSPQRLKPEESALLVGMLKATTAYNPRLHPEAAQRRRNVVLDNMVSHQVLPAAEAERLKAQEINLRFTTESGLEGIAPYFRQAVMNEIQRLNKQRDPEDQLDPYIDGLKIYTSLDSRLQAHAESAVADHMRQLQRNFKAEWGDRNPWVNESGIELTGFIEAKLQQTESYKQLSARYPNDPDRVRALLNEPHLVEVFDYDAPRHKRREMMSTVDSLRYMLRFMHTGFVAIEPQNGCVRAYVGDVDFATWQHDNALATHQPGSTFKLFAYATGIKQGMTPGDDHLKDQYINMDVTDRRGRRSRWTPKNANGRFTGRKTSLRTAFAQSVNTIAVQLGQEVGTHNIIATARDMGITTRLEDAPSLPLGASDVSLLELVGAYASVANNGQYVKPTLITRIVDVNGSEIYTAHPDTRTVLDDRQAFFMQTLLAAGVSDGGGTSQGFAAPQHAGPWYWNNQIDLGGKTGTSNSNADAWFVGVTPRLVAGAWVGGEYRQIHFRSNRLGQGSRAALPIVGLFFNRVLSDQRVAKNYLAHFVAPADVDPSELSAPHQPTFDSLRTNDPETTYADSLDQDVNVQELTGEATNEDPPVAPTAPKPSTPKSIEEGLMQ